MIAEQNIQDRFGAAYRLFLDAVSDYNMLQSFEGGVVVALSGGADSVFLFLCMKALSQKHGFPLCAMHVNHHIRGEEANRDADFCQKLCNEYSVEFHLREADVPLIAQSEGAGLEETARKVRYGFFSEFIENTNFSCVVTAHNATDNTETVIFNLLRGAGTKALCGIPVVRGDVLRPIIYVQKKDITESLDVNGIEYVVDSTNLCNDYTRNYIRHEILPCFERINPRYSSSVRRMNNIVYDDLAYIESQVDEIANNNNITDTLSFELARTLDYAILSRLIVRIYKFSLGGISNSDLEYTHIKKICNLIKGGREFSYDVPRALTFVCDKQSIYIRKKCRKASADDSFRINLSLGENYIPNTSDMVYLTLDENDEKLSKFKNIYKLSIQATFAFDKIYGDMYMRSKLDGDSYKYGGITRKLKKLFNDAKLSSIQRLQRPVICDEAGILWVPSFGVRDGAKADDKTTKKLYLLYYYDGGKNA